LEEESKNPKASFCRPPDGSKSSVAAVEQIDSGSFLWPKIAKHSNDMATFVLRIDGLFPFISGQQAISLLRAILREDERTKAVLSPYLSLRNAFVCVIHDDEMCAISAY
jgi:hypothetical protein